MERDHGVTIAYLAQFLGVLKLLLTYYWIVASTPIAAELRASQWGRCDEGGGGVCFGCSSDDSCCWSGFVMLMDGFGCTMNGLAPG